MWAGSRVEGVGLKVEVNGGLRRSVFCLREGRGRGNRMWAGSGKEEAGFKVQVGGGLRGRGRGLRDGRGRGLGRRRRGLKWK